MSSKDIMRPNLSVREAIGKNNERTLNKNDHKIPGLCLLSVSSFVMLK